LQREWSSKRQTETTSSSIFDPEFELSALRGP
jgi:hypothetical protein